MGYKISGSVGNWQKNAINHVADVRTVQKLLSDVSRRLVKPDYNPIDLDGKISRTPGQSSTVKAIMAFQRDQLGTPTPDGLVGVNSQTWHLLVLHAGPPMPQPPVAMVTITFKHGGKIPTKTHYNPAVAPTYSGLYESSVIVSGGLTGSFRGSIFPDDMTVKGRIKDGTYPVHIGFHKGGGAAKQGADQLKVETNGIRAGLLVNARNAVPVLSANSAKTTSTGVNIHNGFNSQRFSDSCLTISPSDWNGFISLFLNAFPTIDDWHSMGTNTGKKIGDLVVVES